MLGRLHQRVTPRSFQALVKIQKKHLKKNGSFYLHTDNYFPGPFDADDAPSEKQEALRDINRTLGLGYDPKQRGENCAMFKKILTQPRFQSYGDLQDPELTLETLR